MQSAILEHIHQPEKLEALYRSDKNLFRDSFDALYPQLQDYPVAHAWQARLHFIPEQRSTADSGGLVFLLITAFLAAITAKIPDLFPVSEAFYYPRNIGFIVFPFLIATFARQRHLPARDLMGIGALLAGVGVWINLLPENTTSDTLILACIHTPLLLWSLLGYAYSSNDSGKRLGYLRFNGELIVMTGIILIAGGLLTGITLGLFELINLNIQEFYFRYVVVSGLAAAPLVGTYLVQHQPQLVDKVSPVIARVFSPLVLITLVAYLSAVFYTGKDPYTDRDFLLIFNLLLIGVMAIIFFSVAESAGGRPAFVHLLILTGIAVSAVLVNGIALSAILFRINEWGITPNRLAVLGGNLLILTNLLMVAVHLLKTLLQKRPLQAVELSIARFLPLYAVWTLVVVVLFPLVFGFR